MNNERYAATAGRRRTRAPIRHLMGVVLATFAMFLSGARPAAAQSVSEIATAVDQTGSFVEPAGDAELDAAIDRANSNGIGFVWLDRTGGGSAAESLAGDILGELDDMGSRYRTVLVLFDDGFGARGVSEGTTEAVDASLDAFSAGAVATGLDQFTTTLADSLSGTTATTDAPASDGSDSGGGLSLTSILLPLLLLGGGFFLFRGWSNKRKAEKQVAADVDADKAEIKEQLRDNADRVIDLGDRVVLSEDAELIDTYEKASRTYQDVSQSIDAATTPEEVDRLDDRIDEAEWQLEVIEAKLEGRPVPPSPADIAAEEARAEAEEQARRQAENDRPAPGRDESELRPEPQRGPRRSSYPSSRSPLPGGFGRGGGFGGGLGGLLGSIILGGMRVPQSRRTQRRSGSAGRGSAGGGLGGGVLRPRGSSSGSRGSGRTFGQGPTHGGGRDFK